MAPSGSLFAILECGPHDRSTFRRPAAAEPVFFEHIEGCYNPQRRHSILSQLNLAEFERCHAGQERTAA